MAKLPRWNLLQGLTRTRPPRRRRRCDGRGLVLERLEDRTLPSVTIAATNNNGHGYAALDFNHSGGYVPPDTDGAAGPTNYVETVNQTVAIYSPKSTGASATLASLSTFWFTTGGLARADSGSGLSDPVVTYNDQIGRFIVADQDVNFTTHVSRFDIAVSKTSSPGTLTAADWTFYQVNTTESGFDADYPGNFGYNHDATVFTLNMFGVSSGGHCKVISLSNADLAANASQASLHQFQNDLNDFSDRPVVMHDSVAGDPMWLITEHGDNTSVDVIKVGNVLSTAETFTYTNLAVTPYSPAVNPLNPNGTVITNNMDSRILKAAEWNNTIVAAHTVSVSATEDDVQWYAINVGGATPALAQQGRVGGGNNTYSYFPAVDVNASGQIGMTYMRSGNDSLTDFMSMYVTGRNTNDPVGTMQASVVVPAGTGQANYKDFTSGGRAGDLSGINVDPADGSFWAANEFANTEATANWGTAVANFTISVTTSADLAVSASGPASVTAGTTATYTLTLANAGPNDAQNVVLTDLLPAGSTLMSVTPAAGNPDGFTFGQSGGNITETAPAVAAGHTDTFTVVVAAPSGLAAGSAFSDTASASSGTADPNSGNNAATVTGSIATSADVAVTASGPASVTAGTSATYTITLSNAGPSDAQGVVLTDVLPAGSTLVSVTPGAGNPDGFTAGQSGGTITETATAAIAAGHTDTFTVVVAAPSGLAAGSAFSDSASASSGTADPNSGNNAATVTGSIATSADVSVTVSGPSTGTEGANATYTITVTNGGPSAASGVSLTDTLGSLLGFMSATTSQGTFSQSGGVVTFTLGTVAANGTVTATVTALALEDGSTSDVAAVSSATQDPNAANNSASATTAFAEAPITVSAPIRTRSRTLTNVQVATFTHAGGLEPASAFVATINWGDGKTSTGTITLSGTTYSVVGSHTYSNTQRHTITTTVTEATQAVDKVGDERPGDDVVQFHPHRKHDGEVKAPVDGSGHATSTAVAGVSAPSGVGTVALASAARSGPAPSFPAPATQALDHLFSLGGQVLEQLLQAHRHGRSLSDWFVDAMA